MDIQEIKSPAVCNDTAIPRHDDTNEKLTEFVQNNFSGSPSSLHELTPLILEIKRRFKHLPRKINADGKRETILGHTTFKSWSASILNRTVNEINKSYDARIDEEEKQSKRLVKEVVAALDTRHYETDEKLIKYIQSNFSGSQQSLRQLRPFLEEISRRFCHLPRGLGVDGQYKKIAGYRTFKDFCEGVLHRTAHRVRQILREAHGQVRKSNKGKEDIYVVSERVQKYLTVKVNKFEGSERIEILENVRKILESLSASTTEG